MNTHVIMAPIRRFCIHLAQGWRPQLVIQAMRFPEAYPVEQNDSVMLWRPL